MPCRCGNPDSSPQGSLCKECFDGRLQDLYERALRKATPVRESAYRSDDVAFCPGMDPEFMRTADLRAACAAKGVALPERVFACVLRQLKLDANAVVGTALDAVSGASNVALPKAAEIAKLQAALDAWAQAQDSWWDVDYDRAVLLE